MRVHVIYAHPVPASFNAALHRCVVETLRAVGHDVDDLDLYAEGFNPVLSTEERRVYQDIGDNLRGIEEYVARLRAAEALVFCAPTWWYGMPAMLKGYFDRVWVPGVAFDLLPNGGTIQPKLANIRKLVVVTTYGSPWWFMKFYMREPGKRVFIQGLRRLLAPGARMTYLAHYSMDTSTPATRGRFLARVKKAMEQF
jgi:NAD(P)H dehydrogenase (quinone)